MKKWIAIVLSLCILALSGCGKAEPDSTDLLMETENASVKNTQTVPVAEASAMTGKNVDLTAVVQEEKNLTKEVVVKGPADWTCNTYRLTLMDDLPEAEIRSILLPNDNSKAEMKEPELSGCQVLETGSGKLIYNHNNWISLEASDPEEKDKYVMITELLQWKYREDPSAKPLDLEFMSAQDAENQMKDILNAFHMPLTPHLSYMAGMDHEQIMDYQAYLFKNDETYDPFGDRVEMTDLNQDYDAYYMEFYFTLDGIPVFQSPDFGWYSQAEPEEAYLEICKAEILLTGKGIQQFTLQAGIQKAEPIENKPLVDAETAAKNMLLEIGKYPWQGTYQLDAMQLNLVPVFRFGDHTGTLVPLWCSNMHAEHPDGQWIDCTDSPWNFFIDPYTGGQAFESFKK